MNNTFDEFNAAVPGKRLTARALRRRAITRTVVAAGGGMDAAVAIGISPRAARKHSLDAGQVFKTDEVMELVTDSLRLGKKE